MPYQKTDGRERRRLISEKLRTNCELREYDLKHGHQRYSDVCKRQHLTILDGANITTVGVYVASAPLHLEHDRKQLQHNLPIPQHPPGLAHLQHQLLAVRRKNKCNFYKHDF